MRDVLIIAALLVTSVAAASPAVAQASSPQQPVRSKHYRDPGITEITIIPPPPGIVRETDVPVGMRDGMRLYTNVYRPQAQGRYPVILAVTRYGKDLPADTRYKAWAKASGFEIGRMTKSEWCPFEAPDPAFWVPHGYVVIHADVRGSMKSEGNIGPNTEADVLDH